ncbi:hypothetical protein Tco_0533786 [Tanacetum coccineum]
MRNTNFFRAFLCPLASFLYIQQFWNSMKYDEKTGVYCCQVDEQWFNLSADLLRKALDITPVDPAHPFELPPTGDTVIDFVNQLGYPEPVEFVSNIRVNYVYQPWRAILTLINQCLTGKTSGGDKPRHPVLQMLWGIVTQTNVDHAELLWEEFTQGIQTFFSHKASHKASLKDPKKKAVPLLIPYGRFTKMIIYYLGSTSDVHKRPESPCHLPGDDFLLGNLKFISKGETDEVFGMAIPKQLITQAIQQSLYYPKYLEMVAKNTKKTPQDSASKQPEPATKRAPPKKPTTTTPVKPTKPPSSKQPKSPTKKPSKRKLPQKVRKGKPSFQLVDEDDEAQQEPVPQGEGDDPALELAKKMSLDAHQEKGEGEGADADIERAIKLSLDPSFLPQGQAPVRGVAIRDPISETTPKLPEVVGKVDQFGGPKERWEKDEGERGGMRYMGEVGAAGSFDQIMKKSMEDFVAYVEEIQRRENNSERVHNDLSAEEKERYKADIRATNILLQGIPKDIYSLINHYTDAKDIWENVKMILEGSELTKDDRESQLYDEFEHFRQNKGETIQGYYENKYQTLIGCDNFTPRNSWASNMDHIFEADECDAFDSDVDEGPTTQTMFMTNLTSEDRIYDEAGPSYDSNTPYEAIKTYDGESIKAHEFCEKGSHRTVRFGNDSLRAIMGLWRLVLVTLVFTRVTTWKGLGHNLFSVGQFCDSDLEVAFRMHTCFVRDINGADILKGSRSTNLYTISIDEIMKSSPICLLSKASKSKSWLSHHRLNHLNFAQ